MRTKIKITNTSILLQNSYGGRFVFWILILVGLVLSGMGALLCLANFDQDPESLYWLAIGLVMSTIGIVAIYTGLRSPARGFLDQVEFQQTEQALKQSQALRPGESCTVPVDTWRSCVLREVPGTGGQNSTALWALFLNLNDDSYFWLASAKNKTELQALHKALSSLSGKQLPLHPNTPTTTDQSAPTNNPDQSFAQEHTLPASACQATASLPSRVRLQTRGQATWLSLAPIQTTFPMKAMALFILLFFLLVPGVLVLQQASASPDGRIAPLFWLSGSIFAIFWYSVILLVVLLQLKRVQIANRGSALLVRVDFRGLPFLKRELHIDVHNIAAVPVHRVEESHWQLALHLKESIPLSLLTRLLLGLAYKPGPPGGSLLLAGKRITLVDLPAYVRSSRGPGPGDVQELRRRLLEGLRMF